MVLHMKYFVLKPKGNDPYAKASRAAMFASSKHILEENPTLSKEIWDWATNEMPPFRPKTKGEGKR